MEPRREKPKDPNDPREYLPVPHGGPILLGQVIIVAICTALCLGILVAGSRIYRAIEDWSLVVFAQCVMAVGFFGAVPMLIFGCRWIWPDARKYWRRNVRGYRLACFLKNDDSGRPALSHWVIAPGNVLTSEGVSAATLLLPLGGWFRRPTVVMPKERSGNTHKRGQIRIVRLDVMGNQGTAHAIATSMLRLSDRHGNRFTVTVAQALEIFEKFHGSGLLNNSFLGLMSVVGTLKNDREQLMRERDHAQEAHRNAHHALTSALIAMEQTVIAIAKTSRFVGSIEALRIRLFLLERFRGLVPTPDPKEPQRAKWIGWADEEIASARADLARRDRHRRRPSAGAGA